MSFLGGIFSLTGAGLSIVASRHLVRRLRFIRSSAVVPGVVVALREERDGLETRRFRYPKVHFRTVSGRDVTFESGMARSGEAWRIGDTVSVRHRQDDPEIAEINTLTALWGTTLLFALLAVVFLGVGAGLWLGFIPI